MQIHGDIGVEVIVIIGALESFGCHITHILSTRVEEESEGGRSILEYGNLDSKLVNRNILKPSETSNEDTYTWNESRFETREIG